MRAVVTIEHGERDRLQLDENFPDPQAARDEVLLRVAATAVNYHDIFTRRGMPGIRIPLPVIEGSAIAGEVVAARPAKPAWKPTAPALASPVVPDGKRAGTIGGTCRRAPAGIVRAPAPPPAATP